MESNVGDRDHGVLADAYQKLAHAASYFLEQKRAVWYKSAASARCAYLRCHGIARHSGAEMV